MVKSHVFPFNAVDFRKNLLDWYGKNRRALPWRAVKGQSSNPYHVWLSEIMLQQTTVPAVIPYFLKFTQKWPTIDDLATADTDEVMSNWAGLGYYARARNLLKCAAVVHKDFGGVFPSDEESLLALPGVGPYTAAAIASIAFNQPAVVIDGNIERVTSRIFAIETPLPEGKKIIREKAALLFEGLASSRRKDAARDLPQALMDLGSGICTPTSPVCGMCPVNDMCKAYHAGQAAKYPVRGKKKTIPTRTGRVYWLRNAAGEVILEKRGEDRMLGGMMALPTTDWDLKGALQENMHPEDIAQIKSLRQIGMVTHTFSHFHLKLEVWQGEIPAKARYSLHRGREIRYSSLENLKALGLPSVFKKSVQLSTKQHVQE